MAISVAGIIWFGRNIHKVPILKNLVLLPGSQTISLPESEITITGDADLNLSHMIGKIGVTTTPLRPTGKARFGDTIVDATSETSSLDQNQQIEVIGTRGLRVIVRKVLQPENRISEPELGRFSFNEDLFQS